ncbi:hypothetical protein AKJ64_04260 [candidate division MSBL1 archaeon SCGC-AAA259E17]|uniref:tRNA carboxymethyluridine synthase n=1 Tax=candidate division MSBL1 archaeon SCGC-AAA259E17 TaxID=1698263 RepID=A0A133UCT5_9EURY|nr:hypothetical protein AKJ64_04260 [candidate division MSBL1 archaeon SCGC-AAA259E17]
MSKSSYEARRKILEKILSGEIPDRNSLERIKKGISKDFKLSKVPSNAEILKTAKGDEREEVLPPLQRKPVRSISGVTVITVMPRPYPCPKDEPCIYCPGGPDSNTPQSYTGEEPASARAKEANFDPEKQILARKKQLRAIGHKVDKVELIVFGGTFLAQPRDYQEEFMHSCIDAISNNRTPDLETAKKRAETAETRTIGITFETRPDYSKSPHVDQMLRLGGTRVEMGVQTTYEDIYELTNREHNLQDVVEATKTAKDSGLAVVYHMMPGLPGSSPERDLNSFEEIFENPSFRPDMLKIYPCLVIKGTKLYDMWKSGNFDPLEGDEAVELIAEMKKRVPRWVRIQRIQRDIPSDLIEAGVWKGNLRSIVQDRLEEEGERCECIRCREAGHRKLKDNVNPRVEEAELTTEVYEASDGKEVFISYEDMKKDILFGHLRLRIPSRDFYRKEIDEKTAIVRMLYVFGKVVPVGNGSSEHTWQHLGLGKKMLKKSERIASEKYDAKRIAVLSGIGSREYYRQFNYKLQGCYMVKDLRKDLFIP